MARYSKTMRKEIGTIAHSCGVRAAPPQAYALPDRHDDGRSIPWTSSILTYNPPNKDDIGAPRNHFDAGRPPARAAQAESYLIENVRIFNGVDELTR